ncbi:MAG: adenosine deaminase family protein, partial [Alphaproteobacteria bacterium]
LAADAGLSLTAHAGEVCGAESVRACLDDLHVTRIGHGVRSVEDPDLVRRLADEKIVLEVCPGSNVALGVFANRTEHSLDALNKAGVPVTISSDDPPFFRTSLAEEYRQTQAVLGYDDDALNQLTRTSLNAAFVDAPTRARLLARLDRASA